jgi:hypothetical protein
VLHLKYCFYYYVGGGVSYSKTESAELLLLVVRFSEHPLRVLVKKQTAWAVQSSRIGVMILAKRRRHIMVMHSENQY